jgi:hypothetical protein
LNHKALKPLDPELVTVLRAVAHMNLSGISAISQHAGGTVRGALQTLRNRGYIREHTGHQNDGGATRLYSLTAKGEEALIEMGHGEATMPIPARAVPRSSGPGTAIYDGSEMRPFVGRPGAMDAFRYPSRVGKRLYHPDGSVTPVE